MYDFSWSDPMSWVAIGVPVVLFAAVVVSLCEFAKWLMN